MAVSEEKRIGFQLLQEAKLLTQSSIMKPMRFPHSSCLKLAESLSNDSEDRSTGHYFSSSSNQHSFRENNLPLTLPWLFFKIALWTIECLGKLISLLSLSPTFRFSSASRTLARQFIQFCYNYCFVISDLGYAWYMFFFFIQQANLCLLTGNKTKVPITPVPASIHCPLQHPV